MAWFLAIPVLLIVLMLQTAVISRLPLLQGSADLFLLVLAAWALQSRVKNAWFWTILGGLMVSFLSAAPMGIPLISYAIVTFTARFLRRMVWQAPIVAMLVVVFTGTLLHHMLMIVALQFTGVGLPFSQTLSQVTLPSAFLNLLLALPVYWLISEMSLWAHPMEVD